MKRRPFHNVAGGEEGQAQWTQVPDRRSDSAPDAGARSRETAEAIREAVMGLSEKLRLVFVLARYRSLPYAQISEILEIPVGTVKSRMSLAEKTLRARLQDRLGGER
jgi:RNA polymerase sigma-70 factor (ECF subfamily)